MSEVFAVGTLVRLVADPDTTPYLKPFADRIGEVIDSDGPRHIRVVFPKRHGNKWGTRPTVRVWCTAYDLVAVDRAAMEREAHS